jgi:plasmid stabilization system protein ParE
MNEYLFTPQAADDLFEIWSYIARDSIEAANRVEAAICEACDFLAATPLAGHVRKDLSDLPVRFWPVQPYRNYLVVYDPQAQPTKIVRIFHGARNLPIVLTRQWE